MKRALQFFGMDEGSKLNRKASYLIREIDRIEAAHNKEAHTLKVQGELLDSLWIQSSGAGADEAMTPAFDDWISRTKAHEAEKNQIDNLKLQLTKLEQKQQEYKIRSESSASSTSYEDTIDNLNKNFHSPINSW